MSNPALSPPSPPSPPPARRRRLPLLLKLFLGLLAVPLLLSLVLAVQFLVQRQSAWNFIPKQFQLYLQVPSISKVFDEWSQLDALHLAFRENPSLAGLEKTLLKIKSSGLSESALFRTLIDVQAHVVITKQNEAVVVLDLGWRSALTRQLPLVAGWFKLEGLTQIQKNGRSWFQYSWAPGASANILFYDNLALVTFKAETLESLLSLKPAGLSLSDLEKTRINDEFSKPDSGSLRFLADPNALSNSFISDPNLLARLNQNLDWKDSALVSLDLSNEAFSLRAATVLDSKQSAINGLFKRKNTVLNSLRSIPESTYFYTALNLGDFRELLKVWTLFSGQDLEPTLAAAEEGAKVFLGMSIEEMLWSWIGDEAGMLYMANNSDPVFHLKVRDEGKRQKVFQKLDETALVDIERSLVLDNVPISRIVIPAFIKGLLQLFGINFDTPFFLVQNDEMFFSMNAENLARLSNETRSGKLLYRSAEFEQLLAKTAKNPVLFLYYDLDKSRPFFLAQPSLLSKVLRLYNRGALSLFINDGYLDLNMSAIRVEQRKTLPYPGFPLAIKGGIGAAPWIGFLPGRADPVIAAIQNDNEMVLDALAGGERLMSVPLEPGSRLLPPIWGNEILAWAPTGTFYRFQANGQATPPFPLLSPSQGSFEPVAFGDRWLVYSRSENSLFLISRDGQLVKLPTVLDAPVLSAPAVHGSLAALASKSFEGTVLLIDKAGNLQNGWPREGGGISLASPVFIENGAGLQLAFLSQNGRLTLWNSDGSLSTGFPLELNAVFAAPPAVLRRDGENVLACLDQTGTLHLVRTDGTLLRSQALGGGNPEARLVIKDIDGDKNDEIFVYGGKNSLTGLDAELIALPGFPVRGSYQPQFVDLNLDGKIELVSGSYDGNVYAYTIKK